MTDTAPKCMKCGKDYSTPTVFARNAGLCEPCRPVPVCSTCKGAAQVWRDSHFFGSDPRTGKMGWQGSGWDRCPSCHGKRHKAEPHEPIG